jgi:hypothetical protein
MLKRLDLKPHHSRRGTAKRPPLRARPPLRSGGLHAARTFRGECEISHISSYRGATLTWIPYTWVQHQNADGSWVGYYILRRLAWSWGQLPECNVYLATQYEWYRWYNGAWYWTADWNCDITGGPCYLVRSAR